MLTMTLASFWQGLLVAVFIPLSVLLCLIILIQKPKGGGLSGAFGGAGGGTQMFGGKSGDILTWITVGFFVAFLLVSVLLVKATKSDVLGSGQEVPLQQIETEPQGGTESKEEGATQEPALPDLSEKQAPATEEKPAEKPAEKPQEIPAEQPPAPQPPQPK